jgi:uncharacterized protein
MSFTCTHRDMGGIYQMPKCNADECGAKCCTYLATEIDTPRSRADFDEIRWFVAHENTNVYKTDKGDWVLEFVTPCGYLKNQRCTNYENRPNICRDYDPEDCTANKKEQDALIFFSIPEDVTKYIKKRWSNKK